MLLHIRHRFGPLRTHLAPLLIRASAQREYTSSRANLTSSITLQQAEDHGKDHTPDGNPDMNQVSAREKGNGTSANIDFLKGFELPSWLKLLEFKDQEVLQLVLKHPCVRTLGPSDEVEHVIGLFRKEGVSLVKLRQMVMREPSTLKRRKQLEAMLSFYQARGATRKECMKGLIQHPHMLRLSVDDVIQPRMQLLIDLGLSSIAVRRILRNFMNVLGFPVNTSIGSKLEYFENLGLPKEAVLQMIERFPGILQKSITGRAAGLLRSFSSLGVDLSGDDLGSIFRKHPPLLSCSVEHKIEPMLLFLKESGFTAEDIRIIATRHPSIFCLSLENQIKPKIHFVTGILGKSPQDMAKSSDLFTYSFEDRIVRRIAMLQWANKEYKNKSLGTLFGKSENAFENRFESHDVAVFKARWNLLSREEKLAQVSKETRSDNRSESLSCY